MFVDERPKLCCDLRVVATCEVRLDPVLERLDTRIVEVTGSAIARRDRFDVGEGRSPPGRERLPEKFGRRARVPVVENVTSFGGETSESCRVDSGCIDVERIS